MNVYIIITFGKYILSVMYQEIIFQKIYRSNDKFGERIRKYLRIECDISIYFFIGDCDIRD